MRSPNTYPGASRTHTAALASARSRGWWASSVFFLFCPKEEKALVPWFLQRLRRHPRNQSGPLRQPYDQSCSFTSAVLVQRISASHSAQNDPHESPKSLNSIPLHADLCRVKISTQTRESSREKHSTRNCALTSSCNELSTESRIFARELLPQFDRTARGAVGDAGALKQPTPTRHAER